MISFAKKLVTALVFSGLVLFPLVSSADQDSRIHAAADRSGPVRFNELAFGTGYVWGELKGDDSIEIIPFSVRVGFDINKLVGIRGSNTLQLSVEPFVNTIVVPEGGIEAGLNVGFRYKAPMKDGVSFFGEVSSGPAYFSIDTVEQGDYEFNFLSQFGAGLEFALTEKVALDVGYRFRHLSNAGFSQPNNGINTNALIAGIVFHY